MRVVGRGHSFTPVAECKGGTLLSLARLNRVLDFRRRRLGSITIGGVNGSDFWGTIEGGGRRRDPPATRK